MLSNRDHLELFLICQCICYKGTNFGVFLDALTSVLVGHRLYIITADSQWLHSMIEINGYEEYIGTEYGSAGCTEEYKVVKRYLEQSEGTTPFFRKEVLRWSGYSAPDISILQHNAKTVQLDSSNKASVGASCGVVAQGQCFH